MAASLSSFGLGLVVSLLVASACSGNTGSDSNGAAGKTGGGSASDGGSSGGSVSRSGSASGGSVAGGSAGGESEAGANARGGSASGGSVNRGGSANSGGGANGGGAGDAAAGGAAGDSKACQSVDDCIIASVFSNTGCCARTDCGGGYNRAWVLSEPCASANSSTDPVPNSCSQGCSLCPASRCPEPVGVQCNSGKCEAVTSEGPCSKDADCVLALDLTTSTGDCCKCPAVVSKAYEAAVECVTLEGAAKPAGCMFSGTCAGVSCPATCTRPTPVCSIGRCTAG